jgi:hypothetical protein
VQHRFCVSGADNQASSLNLYWASVNRLDKFFNRPGKMLSSPGGQALLVPGLALWLIKNFVSLQQDGQADVILIPRLTQSRFVGCKFSPVPTFSATFHSPKMMKFAHENSLHKNQSRTENYNRTIA